MWQKLKPYIYVAAIWAIYVSTSILAYIIVLDFLDLNAFGRYKYMYMGIAAFVYILAYRAFRQKKKQKLRTQQGIVFGVFLNTFSSIIYIFILYIYMTLSFVRESNIYDKYVHELYLLLERDKEAYIKELGQEAYQNMLSSLEGINLLDIAFDQGIGMYILGFFLTFACALLSPRMD